MNPISFLSVFLTEGGPVALVMAGVFLAGAAVAVERFLVVHAATKTRPQRLVAESLELIDRHDVTSAHELCRGTHGLAAAPLSEVLGEVLTPSGPIIEERLRERADHALSLSAVPVSKRIDLLSTIANTTTLLGLLGTVLGLRDAFGPGAAAAGAAVAGAALPSAGISHALQATAFGIVAAIPLLLAQSYFRSRIEDGVGDARAAAENLIVVLVKRTRAEESARAVLAKERGRYVREAEPATAAASERRTAVVVR